MSIASWIADLSANPLFAGGVGATVSAAIIYQARALPLRLWNLLQRTCTVSLTIDNSDELFDRLAIHLSRSSAVQRARWLRMVEMYDDDEQRWCWKASFGPGWHLIRDGGAWFLIHRFLEEKSAGLSLQRRETMTLTTFGKSQAAMRAMMFRAEKVYEEGDTIRVHLFHKGAYLLADRKPARDPATLFLPEPQKRRIFGDLTRFLHARQWYREHGVPYRRGYLLEGPPGTGKTSLAFVLAGIARRPIYMLNLNTCGGDTGLQLAFNAVEPGAIVVIEDVDTARISNDRAAQPTSEVNVDQQEKVTLGGLLNAVDGLASRENRILIMTSNHADKLDAALLRAGRVDVRERIELIGLAEAEQMAAAYLGEAAPRWVSEYLRSQLPIAPALLQEMLLSEASRRVIPFDPARQTEASEQLVSEAVG